MATLFNGFADYVSVPLIDGLATVKDDGETATDPSSSLQISSPEALENLKKVIDAIGAIFKELFSSIQGFFAKLITDAPIATNPVTGPLWIVNFIKKLIEFIKKIIASLVDTIKIITTLSAKMAEFVSATSSKKVRPTVEAAQDLIEYLQDLIEESKTAEDGTLKKLIGTVLGFFSPIIDGAGAAVDFIEAQLTATEDWVEEKKVLGDKHKKKIEAYVARLGEKGQSWVDGKKAKEDIILAKGLGDINETITAIQGSIKTMMASMVGLMTGIFTKVIALVKDTVASILSWVLELTGSVIADPLAIIKDPEGFFTGIIKILVDKLLSLLDNLLGISTLKLSLEKQQNESGESSLAGGIKKMRAIIEKTKDKIVSATGVKKLKLERKLADYQASLTKSLDKLAEVTLKILRILIIATKMIIDLVTRIATALINTLMFPLEILG